MDPVSGDPGLDWGARFLGLDDTPLILASRSPRRAQLLHDLGIVFQTRPSNRDEMIEKNEAPGVAVIRLARAKALDALRDDERALVIGADTIVVHRGDVLGKPEHAGEARDMLARLSGAVHEVVTGVVVVRSPDGAVFADVATTRVRFRVLTEAEIGWMVESGEAMDKAGAYGIQGLASMVVESIEGDYFNVVGLPLSLLHRLIRKAVQQ